MTSTPADPAADPVQARAERQAAVLQELTDIGMDMARCLRRRALAVEAAAEAAETAEAAPASAAEATGPAPSLEQNVASLAHAFARVARAVRMTLALEERLATEREDRAVRLVAAREAIAAERRVMARERRSLVGLSMVALIDEPERTEREAEVLFDAFDGWMDRAGEADLADHTVGEILERICRDLGLPLQPVFRNQQDASGEHAVDIALAAHRGDLAPEGPRRRGPSLRQLMDSLCPPRGDSS